MARGGLKQRSKQARGTDGRDGAAEAPLDEIEQERVIAELRFEHHKATRKAARHGNLVLIAAYLLNIAQLGRILVLNDSNDFSGSKALFGSNQPVLLIFQLALLLSYVPSSILQSLNLPDLSKSQPVALLGLALIPVVAFFNAASMVQVAFWSVPFIAAFWRLSVIREDRVMEKKLEALEKLKYGLKGA